MKLPILPAAGDSAPGGMSRRGSHRLASVNECQREWAFKFIFRLEPPPPLRRWGEDYFLVGALIHLCLFFHYGARMEHPPAYLKTHTLQEELQKLAKTNTGAMELALNIYGAYQRAGHDVHWTPLGVEHEFNTTIGAIRRMHLGASYLHEAGDDQEVSARIDLVTLINGGIWLVDYKSTKGQWNKNTLSAIHDDGEYAIKWQFIVQLNIVRAAFIDNGMDPSAVQGVMVQRMLKKPPFEVRADPVTIPITPFLEAPETMRQSVLTEERLVRDYMEAKARGDDMELWAPTGSFWNCYRGGRPCSYRPLCLARTPEEKRHLMRSEFAPAHLRAAESAAAGAVQPPVPPLALPASAAPSEPPMDAAIAALVAFLKS